MKRFLARVLVEVTIDLDPAFGLEEAEKMALAASSHNRCDPDKSSVLYERGYGRQAEVTAQTIKSCVGVDIEDIRSDMERVLVADAAEAVETIDADELEAWTKQKKEGS